MEIVSDVHVPSIDLKNIFFDFYFNFFPTDLEFLA